VRCEDPVCTRGGQPKTIGVDHESNAGAGEIHGAF
jgi:hypothetical protein